MNKKLDRFYTYAYLQEDQKPYYIGKGEGNRAYCGTHSVPIPSRERILILKNNLLESEAFKHEKYMIAVLGRKDLGTGILLNKTDGGEGPFKCKYPNLGPTEKIRVPEQLIPHVMFLLQQYERISKHKGKKYLSKLNDSIVRGLHSVD